MGTVTVSYWSSLSLYRLSDLDWKSLTGSLGILGSSSSSSSSTPFAVHYEKIRNHFREMATNSAKIHSLARKYEHLRINQIQLRFLHFNQLLGIHMRHWACKREKYTFINANIKVINNILKVNRDNWHTLKCKHYSLTFLWHCLQFNSIPGQP